MKESIKDGLSLVFQGIERLKIAFPHRAFTIDGRLVGDIGEVIAALDYDIELDSVQRQAHDAVARDGRQVQIKATFKDSLTFRTCPDYYLGFKLYPDGHYDEIYNGPGMPIFERFSHRRGIGSQLLSFPVAELRTLSDKVSARDRIPRRDA